jgi:uncharacterized protein (UPF0276 family)
LPLPYTREEISRTVENIRLVRDFIDVPFAIENVNSYTDAAEHLGPSGGSKS